MLNTDAAEEPALQGAAESLLEFLDSIPHYKWPDGVQAVAELVTDATTVQGVPAFGWCAVRHRWIFEEFW
jgi:hypothetical protein